MARNIGVNFGGKTIIHPGAWARIDANALVGANDGRRNIVFLGTSEGGEPNKLHWFTSPVDAREVLRGGDLLKAGELAWNPSGDGVGAGAIGFIRVAQGAQKATLTKDALTFTSKDWGAWTNQIQVKLETNAGDGSKKLTVYHWKDGVQEIYDNLGSIFDIQYTGSEAYAALTITANSGAATKLELKVGEDSVSASVVKSYDLGAGPWADVATLVADINEHVDFTASLKVGAGSKNIPTDKLDAVADQDIKAAPYTVKALRGDIEQQLQRSQLVDVTVGAGQMPADFDFTFLTGGTDGTVPSSWASQFELLYGEAVYFVVPLTADKAVQAECNNYIATMAEQERQYMVGVYGGQTNESVDEIIARATGMNSSRAVVTYPAIKVQGTSGVETLPGYMTAALVAGRAAGKDIGDPITLDFVNVVGMNTTLKAADVNRLLYGGVTTLEFVRHSSRAGYRIVQGITTYQVDSNPSFRELSMRMVSDHLSTELVELLETKFVGGKGTHNTVALIRAEVQAFLDRKIREEILVEYDPASVAVRLEGDVVYVDYSVMPVGALNYILISTKYYQQPITG